MVLFLAPQDICHSTNIHQMAWALNALLGSHHKHSTRYLLTCEVFYSIVVHVLLFTYTYYYILPTPFASVHERVELYTQQRLAGNSQRWSHYE